MTTYLNYFVFGVFGAVGIVFIIGNWAFLCMSLIAKKRGISFVPLLGGLFGAMALYAAPWKMFRDWAWLSFVIDPGTWMFLCGLPYLVKELSAPVRRDGSSRKNE